MKNWTEKSWRLLVMTITVLSIMFNVSCGTIKTVEKSDKEKKECCSKKESK
tara:strand:+ start:279 stop:431 length:153 start_codon:yes stop_codon:yes gene_type:complete